MGADLGMNRPKPARAYRVESGVDPVILNLDVGPKGPGPDPTDPLAGGVFFDLGAATADAADQLGAIIDNKKAAADNRKAWTYAAVGFAVGWLLARR